MKKLILILSGILIIVSYQNCSNSGFNAVPLSKKNNLESDSLPSNSNNDQDEENSDAEDSNSESNYSLDLDPLFKGYPKGTYESKGLAKLNNTMTEGINQVNAPGTEDKVCMTLNNLEKCAKDGVLVSVPWDLFDLENETPSEVQYNQSVSKLIDYIETQVSNAEDPLNGISIALIVSDGDSVPRYIKTLCENSVGIFNFIFRQTDEFSMCFPWDPVYLTAKENLIKKLGEKFDDRKGLAYVYFTGPCSTNGNEGHCRIEKSDYAKGGNDPYNRYTVERMDTAYQSIMSFYLNAFKKTPITFEAHALFRGTNSADMTDHPFRAIWTKFKDTKRIGISAWWCAERLSVVEGDIETTMVWDLIQEASKETFSVCQTVGKVTTEPYRFTAKNKLNTVTGEMFSLDFGYLENENLGYSEADYSKYYDETTKTILDLERKNAVELNVFNQLMDWSTGKNHHAGQSKNIFRFSVMEAWSADLKNKEFTQKYIENF